MRKILISILVLATKVLKELRFGRFSFAKFTYDFLLRHLKQDVASVAGHRMFLDATDILALSIYGIYEPMETELVKKTIKRGDNVLDLGAHIGYYTLIFAELVGEEGKVFAFEPDPNNFALLEKNVKINGYRNVVLVQKAVSNKTGNIGLYLSEDNTGDHRVYDSHDNRKNIEVEAVRLDDYFNYHYGKIDFIKMDLQGAEGDALQGAANLLEKNENVKLLTEFWPFGLKTCGIGADEYLKTFIRHGFKLYHINQRKKKIEAVDTSELLEIYTSEEERHTNLLCVREK